MTVKIPPNTILSPSPEAAVVGGNVLTSQRVTDVILKAFNAAAASQVHTPANFHAVHDPITSAWFNSEMRKHLMLSNDR